MKTTARYTNGKLHVNDRKEFERDLAATNGELF